MLLNALAHAHPQPGDTVDVDQHRNGTPPKQD